jgi:hypothetical protein
MLQNLKSTIVRDLMQCRLIEVYRCFGRKYCLCLQDRRIIQQRIFILPVACWVTLRSWRQTPLCISGASVNFCRTIRCHIPEDSIVYCHWREKLSSRIVTAWFLLCCLSARWTRLQSQVFVANSVRILWLRILQEKGKIQNETLRLSQERPSFTYKAGHKPSLYGIFTVNP